MKELLFRTMIAVSAVTPAALGDVHVFTGTGTDAQVTVSLNAFRDALGPLNPNAPGSFGTGRREINWDGVPDNLSAPNLFPPDFFNANLAGRARGAVFSTPGGRFQMSADNANPTQTPTNFANLNPQYGGLFRAFSPQRLFTPIDHNIMQVDFFIPGTNTPATVSGFGVVFSDVDLSVATEILFINERGLLAATVHAPAATTANGGASFAGAILGGGERISRIEIITGSIPVDGIHTEGPTADGGFADLVVMDDFVYGEPLPRDAHNPCDTNCDGSVNQFDMQAFVALLSQAATPCSPGAGDTNTDGSVNQFDIQGFVNCLAFP